VTEREGSGVPRRRWLSARRRRAVSARPTRASSVCAATGRRVALGHGGRRRAITPPRGDASRSGRSRRRLAHVPRPALHGARPAPWRAAYVLSETCNRRRRVPTGPGAVGAPSIRAEFCDLRTCRAAVVRLSTTSVCAPGPVWCGAMPGLPSRVERCGINPGRAPQPVALHASFRAWAAGRRPLDRPVPMLRPCRSRCLPHSLTPDYRLACTVCVAEPFSGSWAVVA